MEKACTTALYPGRKNRVRKQGREVDKDIERPKERESTEERV